MPDKNLPKLIQETLFAVAPKSTDEVFLTCGCGTSANEMAFKLALYHYSKTHNADEPGEIIAFQGGFHGRLLGALSATRSKGVHKVGIPSFKWRGCPFPEIKHPSYLHESYNKAQEDACLQQFEEICQSRKVAAVIVEPSLAEGGDKWASGRFFIGLQEIVRKYGGLFIVDEVQTGGGPTGRFWAHEHWGPSADPDIVTFAKKMQVSGFYYKQHLTVGDPEELYNRHHGDMLRLLDLKTILGIIKADRLVKNADITGMQLKAGLMSLSARYPIMSNVRGVGTFLAYDLKDDPMAAELVKELIKVGVNSGLCGNKSIRMRPSLVFAAKHAALYLERLEFALQRLS
jgi:4-aminobutyrate aminotransferase / (S)-3-amino-2-methylpropionate transaminase